MSCLILLYLSTGCVLRAVSERTAGLATLASFRHRRSLFLVLNVPEKVDEFYFLLIDFTPQFIYRLLFITTLINSQQ